MSIQVSEQPFIQEIGQGSEVPSNLNILKRMCNCFLMGESSEGRKTIVTTDHLSLEI